MDNAATTPLSKGALAAMLPLLQGQSANPSSLHSFAREEKKQLEQARRAIARCLNANSRELVFTASGSEGDNTVLYGGGDPKKKHILASAIEHPAILNTLAAMAKRGQCRYTLLPVDERGLVSVETLKAAITEDTRLVSIMLANNETGAIQPIKALADAARERGVAFHTDAVQAVGHMNVDVQELGVDYLTLSAHKFHGPKGVGALYIRSGAPMIPFITGGEQERDRRAGTENVPGAVGMAAALQEALTGLQEDTAALLTLSRHLYEGIMAIPHTRCNSDLERGMPHILNFSFQGVKGEQLLMLLDQRGIAASSGSACTAGSLEPSHVLLAMGLGEKEAKSALRLSLSRYNTKQEAERLVTLLPEIIALLRS